MITRQSKGSELTYDELDANFLESISHTDDILIEAKTYADNVFASSTAITVSETYADTKLVEAKTYADAVSTTVLTDAKTYVDTVVVSTNATTLTDAKTYTDTVIATSNSSSNIFEILPEVTLKNILTDPSATSSSSNFDISGDNGVIGTTANKAYIFDTLTGNIKATIIPDSTITYYFSDIVAISSDKVVVGITSDIPAINIYDLTGVLQSTISISAAATQIQIQNDYLIIGCENIASATNATDTYSGIVYVYNLIDNSLLYKIENPNSYGSAKGDTFGHSIDISDNYIIVGAPFSGAIYVYTLTGTLLHTISNPNVMESYDYDNFGEVVKITDKYFAVAAKGEDANTNHNNEGVTYIFDTLTGELKHILNNPIVGSNYTPYFGRFMDIEGDVLLITEGSPSDVYLYDLETGLETYKFTIPSTATSFGDGVKLNNHRAFISDPSNNRIYNFELPYNKYLDTINSMDKSTVQKAIQYTDDKLITANVYTDRKDVSNRLDTLNTLQSTFDEVSSTSLKNVLSSTNTDSIASIASNMNYLILGISKRVKVYSIVNDKLLYTIDVNDTDYGLSVAINDNYFLVGSNAQHNVAGNGSGLIFKYSTGTGKLLDIIENPVAAASSGHFGANVTLSGNYFIAGDYVNKAASIFKLSDSTLVRTITNSTSSYMGESCSIYNDNCIIGDAYNGTGLAYVLEQL